MLPRVATVTCTCCILPPLLTVAVSLYVSINHHPPPPLQVGDLIPALKGRLADTNKNTVAQALTLLAALAKAMGRPFAREARPILGNAVKCICDSKPYVSDTACWT